MLGCQRSELEIAAQTGAGAGTGLSWAGPPCQSSRFTFAFVSQFQSQSQSQSQFRFRFHCMILHKTTVCMSVCLLSPSSFYSCCLEQANLNFWQFLLPSHDIIPAQTDCSPNQEKRNIEEPNIEKQKQKLVSLCFTFAFCCCLFFGAYFCRSVSLFSFISFALRLRLAATIDRQFAESSRDVLGINRARDRETDKETTW